MLLGSSSSNFFFHSFLASAWALAFASLFVCAFAASSSAYFLSHLSRFNLFGGTTGLLRLLGGGIPRSIGLLQRHLRLVGILVSLQVLPKDLSFRIRSPARGSGRRLLAPPPPPDRPSKPKRISQKPTASVLLLLRTARPGRLESTDGGMSKACCECNRRGRCLEPRLTVITRRAVSSKCSMSTLDAPSAITTPVTSLCLAKSVTALKSPKAQPPMATTITRPPSQSDDGRSALTIPPPKSIDAPSQK
jgi:hypothetical protein